MKDLGNTTVAIIGLGASGVAAARLALSRGALVYASDQSKTTSTAARGDELRAAGASVDVGSHDLERVAGSGLVVVSPGIGPDAPLLRALADRGVTWIGEPELASWFLPGSLIAITGTNGKTTVTLLVEHLLRAAGIRAAAGGNVGGGLAPAASELALRADPPDWSVLEMSSFQLAYVRAFRPDIGVVTNLSPDHLDRYDSVEAYYADKARLFERADERSRWVLPHDDADVARLAGDAPGQRYSFGAGEGAHARVAGGRLVLDVGDGTEELCSLDELPLLGEHNVRNALAAGLVAHLAGASSTDIGTGLRTATALPHRLEPVRELDGVLWVNDSKATNVAAAVSAVASLSRTVVLLAGGTDKGESYAPLAAAVARGVRSVLVYGAAAPRMATALASAATPVEHVEGDLAEVVDRARAEAREGDVVLLSPACSSFDMFESYEHRGRRFRELVEALS